MFTNLVAESYPQPMKKLLLIIIFFSLPLLLLAQDNQDNAVALQYYQDGEYEKAAAMMEKLFMKTKDEAYFDLYFKSLLKSKQYQEAEKVVKKLIRQNPEDLKYGIALGKTYKESGQQANAVRTYSQIIEHLPKDEFAIRELANNFFLAEEYDFAVEAFLQGRKVMGNDQLFTFELLSVYRLKKDKARLIEEYLHALSTMPQLFQQAQMVFSAVFEGKSDFLLLQNAIFKKIQKEPQNESFIKLLVWQYLQQEDYEQALRQLIAQDKRIKDNGALLFENAQIFAANKAYDTAVKAYTYVLAKGKENEYYLPSKLAMIDTQYQQLLLGSSAINEIKTLADAYQAILDEYGQNIQTCFAMQKLAYIKAYYLHDLQKAEEVLETALKIPGLQKLKLGELKLALADIYVLNEEPWEAILLYEQLAREFENQNIGDEAKFRSARLSFYQGNFSYAKSQSDVLKASTAQLIANDAMELSLLLSEPLETAADTLALKGYARAELLQFKNMSQEALSQLDSLSRVYPQNNLADEILMSKSRVYIKNKEFAAAAQLLKALIDHPQKNRLTDDALFILAGLYEEQLKDPALASTLYQRLITDFPGSMYVAEARRHFRKLRGDNIGT